MIHKQSSSNVLSPIASHILGTAQKPVRYIVRHFARAEINDEQGGYQEVIVSYNTALNSMTRTPSRGVTFAPFSLSCAMHTAARHAGKIYADYEDGKDFEFLKSYETFN